jgi:hypothetical protein
LQPYFKEQLEISVFPLLVAWKYLLQRCHTLVEILCTRTKYLTLLCVRSLWLQAFNRGKVTLEVSDYRPECITITDKLEILNDALYMLFSLQLCWIVSFVWNVFNMCAILVAGPASIDFCYINLYLSFFMLVAAVGIFTRTFSVKNHWTARSLIAVKWIALFECRYENLIS